MPGNAPYKGHDSQIVVGVESNQGTTVTPTRHFGKIAEETSHPDPTVNWYEEYLIGGNRELSDKDHGQNAYDGGDYPLILYDGFPIALLLGQESVQAVDSNSDGTTDYWVHTLTAKMDGMPPTVTVEATQFGRGGGKDFVRTFGGVAAMSGEISTDSDSRLTCSLEAEALNVSTGTSPTTGLSLPTANPWKFSDISSDLSIATTSFARLEDFSLSIDNGSESRYYITSQVSEGDPYEILYGNVSYDMSATITVDDDTLYQELVSTDDASFDVNARWTRANGDYVDITAKATDMEEAAHSTPRGDDEAVSVEATMIPESITVEVRDSNSGGAYL